MNENKKEYSFDYGGKNVVIETGRLAKQADGSVLISCNGTQVLVTACSSREMKDGQDFFPLTVDYVEKFYAAGKFLGGFIKREAKPSVGETLNARLIDRPLRPLFPKGYMFETIIAATVLSYGENGDAEVLAGMGASAALCISDIPFGGPVSTAKVGRIDGKLVLNPSHAQWENSDLELAVSASKDAILMVEGEAEELSESEMMEAIEFAHEHIRTACDVMEKMREEVGVPKREFVSAQPNETFFNKVKEDFSSDARSVLDIVPKLERQKAVKSLEKKVAETIEKDPESFGLSADVSFGKEAYSVVDELLYHMMRNDIMKEEKRIAGRGLDEVRQIETEVNVLDTPHGSGLFTRGETQVLSTVTVGGVKGEQMTDRISGQNFDRFYLHYNFPPFSVGEARGKFNVSRRELGHGNLAERALKAVLPNKDDFGYTMRVACEVLESNGSSSMGSVCSGSMALMDAGVPLKEPVGGIAMGLIKEGDDYKVLTDILGDEDHLGDMDFKVAGTTKGITAIQMDIKIEGISKEIFVEALDKAKNGRNHILGEMAKTISKHRANFKDGVPRMVSFKIPQDKIGALIGPGGKNVKAVQEKFDVTLECEEDGTVKVLGLDDKILSDCQSCIELQIKGPEIGKDYLGKVITLKEYGAFVDIVPGVSGLVHISEVANERVNDIHEYLSEGDEVEVKVLDVDRMGKIKLSAKAVKPLGKKS
ncbi:MAG: polyribonucleotide nucleotidyltransferase [Halobacteriovoraceae bacterium]|nr:polyribonucleotide nucleotidyltransferase [Halobacteriovoraceae bacterium]|tara:strand:- start:429 stop:2552 length:2124 start_codon:yes stop_codon:yes gene_type:complete